MMHAVSFVATFAINVKPKREQNLGQIFSKTPTIGMTNRLTMTKMHHFNVDIVHPDGRKEVITLDEARKRFNLDNNRITRLSDWKFVHINGIEISRSEDTSGNNI